MLTRYDLRFSEWVLKWFCRLKIWPVNFKESSGKFSVNNSKWSRGVSFIWRILNYSHTLYNISKSLHSMYSDGFKLVETPLMCMWSVGYFTGSYAFFVLCSNPDLNVILLNEFHSVQLVLRTSKIVDQNTEVVRPNDKKNRMAKIPNEQNTE
jgi:hypothetical protein